MWNSECGVIFFWESSSCFLSVLPSQVLGKPGPPCGQEYPEFLGNRRRDCRGPFIRLQ